MTDCSNIKIQENLTGITSSPSHVPAWITNFPNGNLKQQLSHIGFFICYQNIDAKKLIKFAHLRYTPLEPL